MIPRRKCLNGMALTGAGALAPSLSALAAPAEFDGKPAHELASRRHGRIVMANADARGQTCTDAAIDAAWRPVRELQGAA
jgi:hypothetical protein